MAGVRARGCPPRSRAHDSVRDLADARAPARPPKYGGRNDVRDLAQALIRVAENDRKISRNTLEHPDLTHIFQRGPLHQPDDIGWICLK